MRIINGNKVLAFLLLSSSITYAAVPTLEDSATMQSIQNVQDNHNQPAASAEISPTNSQNNGINNGSPSNGASDENNSIGAVNCPPGDANCTPGSAPDLNSNSGVNNNASIYGNVGGTTTTPGSSNNSMNNGSNGTNSTPTPTTP